MKTHILYNYAVWDALFCFLFRNIAVIQILKVFNILIFIVNSTKKVKCCTNYVDTRNIYFVYTSIHHSQHVVRAIHNTFYNINTACVSLCKAPQV